jgi:hypothetical protein
MIERRTGSCGSKAGYVFADVRDRPGASLAHIVQARLEFGL